MKAEMGPTLLKRACARSRSKEPAQTAAVGLGLARKIRIGIKARGGPQLSIATLRAGAAQKKTPAVTPGFEVRQYGGKDVGGLRLFD
jgi:hypothetical protein